MIQPKLKPCSGCAKSRVIFKNKTINGDKFQFCQPCWNKVVKETAKEKRKIKREKKREIITEKKLDTIFSKLVRSIYPPYCHSSKVPITLESSHCAHLVSRKNRCVRFDLRNCYPTTPQENMFNQLHVIQLAKRLKEYYGIDIEDWETATKQCNYKLSPVERKYLYDVFSKGLTEVQDINRINDVDLKQSKLIDLRLEIVKLTKKIL